MCKKYVKKIRQKIREKFPQKIRQNNSYIIKKRNKKKQKETDGELKKWGAPFNSSSDGLAGYCWLVTRPKNDMMNPFASIIGLGRKKAQ